MSSDKLGPTPALPSSTAEMDSTESSTFQANRAPDTPAPSQAALAAALAGDLARAEARALAQADAKARARARAKEKREEKAAAKAAAERAAIAAEQSPQVPLDLRLPAESATVPAITASGALETVIAPVAAVPEVTPDATAETAAAADPAAASDKPKPVRKLRARAPARTTTPTLDAAAVTPTVDDTARPATDAAAAATADADPVRPARAPRASRSKRVAAAVATAAVATPPTDEAIAPPAAVVAAETGAKPGAALITHRVHPVALGRKRDALQRVLEQLPGSRVLVYTRTKHGADKIARFLERCGIKAASIHGDKSHGARARALNGFGTGEILVLVVTDIAARVLTLEPLPLIINYDLPYIADDYLQRVGRSLAQDGSAIALSLITQEESLQFRAVRDLLPVPMELVPLEGFEAAEPFDPERDPPAKAEIAAEANPAADAYAGTHAHREKSGRGRRERRTRHDRGEIRVPDNTGADSASALDAPTVVVAEDTPQTTRDHHPARKERGPRSARPLRADRQPAEDRQPFAPIPDDDEESDGPERGNSLAAPPPSQLNHGSQGRRRGRRDPFAPVVIDENRANIYDERQPDDYRDQWSVLGPDTERPAWTYADHHAPPAYDPAARAAEPGRRQGSGGAGKSRNKPGAGRNQQRSGRRRVENR